MKRLNMTKEKILLMCIVVLSAVLNFGNLGIEGYSNQYYAAGVKSMTLSLKNFFFVSFDPSGFVTIDKPPLGFWLQAISAKIFGFNGWSILLPQALAGVISVILLYHIVKRNFGSAAGLISALCLAITPIFVAVSRNNTIDNMLVMTLLFACWALSIAAEKGKMKFLIISLAIVGIGFNIKMLEAYMIAPALYITYLLSSSVSMKKRIAHLAIGTAVLFAVSFSWAVIVDLIPSSGRPFVGSSTNNSVMELILGHNGVERLTSSNNGTPGGGKMGHRMMGQPPSNGNNQGAGKGTNQMPGNSNSQGFDNGGSQPPSNSNGQGFGNGNGQQPSNSNSNKAPGNGNNMGPGNGGGPGFGNSSSNSNSKGSANNSSSKSDNKNGFPGFNGHGGMGYGFGGMRPGVGGNRGGMGSGTFGGTEKASVTRLFSNNSLSDQIIWLFPLAIFGFIAAVIKEKLRFKCDNGRKLALVMFFMWLIPEFIYFSYTKGLFHPYYLTMMAAPIAALAGIGIVSMWQLYRENGWKSYILPAAILTNGAIQLIILSYFYKTSGIVKILMIIVAVLCLVSSIALIAAKLLKKIDFTSLKKAAISIGLVGLLITPGVWSFTTLVYPMSGTFPSAGVELASSNNKMGGGMGSFNGNINSQNDTNAKLVKFLKANAKGAKYLVAVQSANGTASELIIKYGISVMTLGGFSGSDNILTLNQFKKYVKSGQLRYVIVNGFGGGGGMGQNSTIMNWVTSHGKAVSESQWSGSKSNTNTKAIASSTSQNSKSVFGGGQRGFGMGNNIQLYDLKGSL